MLVYHHGDDIHSKCHDRKYFQTTKISSKSILADNSLAEFEELENQLAGSQGSLKEIDYDAILAEIDQDLDDGIGREGFKYYMLIFSGFSYW